MGSPFLKPVRRSVTPFSSRQDIFRPSSETTKIPPRCLSRVSSFPWTLFRTSGTAIAPWAAAPRAGPSDATTSRSAAAPAFADRRKPMISSPGNKRPTSPGGGSLSPTCRPHFSAVVCSRRSNQGEHAMTNTGLPVWTRFSGAAVALAAGAPVAFAHAQPDTYGATASLKTAGGTAVTAPVVVSITRWTTDAERDKAMAALKSGGSEAFQKAIAGLPEAGTMQVGGKKTPLRYARALPVAGGNVISAATSEPMHYLSAGAPDAKPTAGYGMAVALFPVDAAGEGAVGDLSPAAQGTMDAQCTN